MKWGQRVDSDHISLYKLMINTIAYYYNIIRKSIKVSTVQVKHNTTGQDRTVFTIVQTGDGRSRAISLAGRLYSPWDVLIVATWVSPCFPGWVAITFASSHFAGITLPSCNITTPTSIFLDGWCHFMYLLRYSVDHLCQKCHTRAWRKCQWLRRDRGRYENAGSCSDSRGRPIRKCPWASISILSSSVGIGANRRIFKHDSIWEQCAALQR